MGENKIYFSLSGCSAGGSALDWGSRGRRFKSCHSEEKALWRKLYKAFFTVSVGLIYTAFKSAYGFKLHKNSFLSGKRGRCHEYLWVMSIGDSKEKISKKLKSKKNFQKNYWQSHYRVLRYTSCRKKQDSKSRKKARKIKASAKMNRKTFCKIEPWKSKIE